MSRREAHFDAMLQHLGAVYYRALQEEAAAADVERAARAATELPARRDHDTEAGRGEIGAPKAGLGAQSRGS